MSVDHAAELRRLRDIQARLVDIDGETAELRSARQVIVQRLLDDGMSLADIAALVGVTRQRVHQWGQP